MNFERLCELDFVKYIKSFNIICCAVETFTRVQFDFSIHFSDYIVLHSPAKKCRKKKKRDKLSKHGRRSGGAAALIHKTVMSFVSHMESEHDNMICFMLAKDAVDSDRDLLIMSVYVPSYLQSILQQTICHIHRLEEVLSSSYEIVIVLLNHW